MSAVQQSRAWFENLMTLNGEAFAEKRYEVAYHVLMAALHAAQDAGDPAGLRWVERTAEEQQTRIDTDTPRHRLSSDAARHHGALGIFQMAARQASARAAIVQRHFRIAGN